MKVKLNQSEAKWTTEHQFGLPNDYASEVDACEFTNRQDAFSYVWEYITLQGAPAVRGIGPSANGFIRQACLYSDPETGRHCAAGCLLPEASQLVGKAFNLGLIGASGLESLYPGIWGALDERFISALQGAHDQATDMPGAENFVAEFQRRMTLVAKTFNLQVPSGGKEERDGILQCKELGYHPESLSVLTPTIGPNVAEDLGTETAEVESLAAELNADDLDSDPDSSEDTEGTQEDTSSGAWSEANPVNSDAD